MNPYYFESVPGLIRFIHLGVGAQRRTLLTYTRITYYTVVDHGGEARPYLRVGPNKGDENFTKRGFDFEYASRIFDGDTIEWGDTRRDYGERRVIAIGEVEEQIYVIVYTPREQVRRIISARPASRRERNAYHKAFPRRDS